MLPHTARRGDDLGDLPIRLAEAAASFHTIPIDELPASIVRPESYDAYLDARGSTSGARPTATTASADPFLRYVAAWLDAHRPPPVPLTLIHGDFQSANLLVDDDGHLVILDWELAQIGDPREDLGYFKAVAQAAPPDLIEHDLERLLRPLPRADGPRRVAGEPGGHQLLPGARRRRHRAPAAGGRRRLRPGREPPADVGVQHELGPVRTHDVDAGDASALEAAFAAAKGA